MQKKLIALAIATAFSAPAFADTANISFYGTVDVSYDMVTTGDGVTTANGATAVSGVSKQVVSSNVSKFGFKGSEELGGGLVAVWQIEQQINIDDSSNTCAATTVPAGAPAAVTVPACKANNGIFATRNTFAGLKSDFGTVLMGRHDTPYKISTRKLDVFGDNIADNRALLGNKSQAGFELRPTDVLAYISPAFMNVTAAVAMVNLTEGNKISTDKENSALSMAVMYDAAPFYGSFGYEKHALETVIAGGEESATRFGFGYKDEMFSVGGVYEKTTDNTGTAGADKYGHSAFYIGGKMHLGSGAVKVAYGNAGEYGNIVDSAASQVSFGYDYTLSKRTTVYGLYTKITNGKGVNYGFSQNSGAGSTTSGYGTSPSALSLGMKHTF